MSVVMQRFKSINSSSITYVAVVSCSNLWTLFILIKLLSFLPTATLLINIISSLTYTTNDWLTFIWSARNGSVPNLFFHYISWSCMHDTDRSYISRFWSQCVQVSEFSPSVRNHLAIILLNWDVIVLSCWSVLGKWHYALQLHDRMCYTV